MKKFAMIFILFLITGCATVSAPAVTVEPDPEPTVTEPTVTEPTVIEPTVTEAPSVELDWDRDPETLVIQVAASGSGSASNAALINQLFMSQVWGDGRIVWTTWADDYNDYGDYQRYVWQGQLSEAEMTTLLETFADKGFFRMKARYAPDENVLDGGTTRLSVHLLSREKVVSEYFYGAPDGFHELIDLLTSGAGVEATPYVPQSGQLDAIEAPDYMAEGEYPIWDATALGLDLHDAARVWVEGDALLTAWEVVNQSSFFPIVVQDGSYFELYLRLPEIGVMAIQ